MSRACVRRYVALRKGCDVSNTGAGPSPSQMRTGVPIGAHHGARSPQQLAKVTLLTSQAGESWLERIPASPGRENPSSRPAQSANLLPPGQSRRTMRAHATQGRQDRNDRRLLRRCICRPRQVGRCRRATVHRACAGGFHRPALWFLSKCQDERFCSRSSTEKVSVALMKAEKRLRGLSS